jgi:pimeloyl-ACP methyl ester carboxylesterase
MRFFALLFALLFTLPSLAADYAREQKWADEILPAVLTGDPVWLEQANGHKFLGLYTEAPDAKAGVILVHGIGVHPDWGLISMLRQRLPEAGYATLSVQMPVLKADAKTGDYLPTYDEAAERIAKAVAFMQAKGYKKIVLSSHSLGCAMTGHYLDITPKAPIAAWVAISSSWALNYANLDFPVLDIYGDNDLPQVKATAGQRAMSLKGPSAQIRLPGADHFYESSGDELFNTVLGFLDKSL